MSAARGVYPFKGQTLFSAFAQRTAFRYVQIETLAGDPGRIYLCWSSPPLTPNFDITNPALFDAVVQIGSRAHFDTGDDGKKFLSIGATNVCTGWLTIDTEPIETTQYSASAPGVTSFSRASSTASINANASLVVIPGVLGTIISLYAWSWSFSPTTANVGNYLVDLDENGGNLIDSIGFNYATAVGMLASPRSSVNPALPIQLGQGIGLRAFNAAPAGGAIQFSGSFLYTQQ